MRVFVYEFVSGGGFYTRPTWGQPAGSLLVEGLAMLQGVIEDLAGCPNIDVTLQIDQRVGTIPLPKMVAVNVVASGSEHNDSLAQLGSHSDWTLLIVPEIENVLGLLAQRLEVAGIRLLGPTSQFICLTSDKTATAKALQQHGVAVPNGGLVFTGRESPGDTAFPIVVKPNYGAGSLGTHLIRDRTAWLELVQNQDISNLRWETFWAGTPASIAILGGPAGAIMLPPCYQWLSGDRSFTYQGGSLITEPSEIDRCRLLAKIVTDALGCNQGYWGIDLILGEDPAGSDDVVMEINPRLTSSYVGLRKAIHENLAQLMIATVNGEYVSLSLVHPNLQFDVTGRIWQ